MTFEALAVPVGLAVTGGAERSEGTRGLREDDRLAVEACQQGEREAFDRLVFFFDAAAPPEIYTVSTALSLLVALPIYGAGLPRGPEFPG